jgi:hypothetical protein
MRDRWRAAPERIRRFTEQLHQMQYFVAQLHESLPLDNAEVFHRQTLQEFAHILEVSDDLNAFRYSVKKCTPQAELAALALRLPGSVYAEHCAVLMAHGLPQPVILCLLAHGQPELSAALPEHVREEMETRTRRLWNARHAATTALGKRERDDE